MKVRRAAALYFLPETAGRELEAINQREEGECFANKTVRAA